MSVHPPSPLEDRWNIDHSNVSFSIRPKADFAKKKTPKIMGL